MTLVDTHGHGVERIAGNAVIANGLPYAIDCLIYATGFEVGTSYTHRTGYEIEGRGGLSLSEKWKDGIHTFQSLMTRGFPNCFILGNASHTPFTPNFPHGLSLQARQTAHIIHHCLGHGVKEAEPSQKAESEWVDMIVSTARRRTSFLEKCTPSWFNNEGAVSSRPPSEARFAGGARAFERLLENWRTAGDLEGLELTWHSRRGEPT